MTPPNTLDEAFKHECETLLKIFLQKHKDYGKGNILEIEELGIAFRAAEKVSRLKNLLSKGESASNEPIEDSWHDLAVYSIIALLYRKGLFQTLEVNAKLQSDAKR